MLTDPKIANEILRLANIKVLVETYEMVAATSMRRIRNSVLQNREFHDGLSGLYKDVKMAHLKEIRKLLQERDAAKKILQSVDSKKTVYVYLSANTGLYGEIINKTFQLFFSEWQKKGCDALIIGKIGKFLAEGMAKGKQFLYCDFPDNKIDPSGLKHITEILGKYEHVIAFYGSFKSLLVQEPTSSSVSGEDVQGAVQGDVPVVATEVRFLFEPSIEKVTSFFETEIFASLLEQVFHESRLAKLSSRMLLLDRANLNIDEELKKVSFRAQRTRHRLYNRKQLDALSGVALWSRQ